jgi:hypothetical protein
VRRKDVRRTVGLLRPVVGGAFGDKHNVSMT